MFQKGGEGFDPPQFGPTRISPILRRLARLAPFCGVLRRFAPFCAVLRRFAPFCAVLRRPQNGTDSDASSLALSCAVLRRLARPQNGTDSDASSLALSCAVLRRLAPFCAVSRRFAPFCTVLCRFAPFCAILRRFAPSCAVSRLLAIVGPNIWGAQNPRPLFSRSLPKLGGKGPLSPLKIFFLVCSSKNNCPL